MAGLRRVMVSTFLIEEMFKVGSRVGVRPKDAITLTIRGARFDRDRRCVELLVLVEEFASDGATGWEDARLWNPTWTNVR